MLRFRLGRIPVEVHFSHLFMAALLTWSFFPRAAGGWEGHSAAFTPSDLVYLALGTAVVFGSVLIHELGHALVSLGFGYRPSIQLVWMGGNTQPNAGGPIPWHKDVVLTLAGPIAGLGLSVGSYYLHRAIGVGVSAPADYVLQLGFGANLVWAVYNLLPVQPLDGGRVAMAVLMRLFGRTGFLLAHLLALALAMAIVAYFLIGSTSNQLLVVLFMASYAVRSVGAIAAYLRGELPVGGPLSMLAQQQARAWELFRAGNLEEAEAQVNTTLEGEPRPAIKAGAHHLLGWICLKRGKGREALDHFSQVQKMKVEKVALAAAYSLIGDEARALPLWEQAFVETRDQTVLHEWAGALLRADRESEVRRLPGGVDLATAWACARSVLVLRGDHAAAALAGEEELRLRPTPSLAYDTACAFARSGTKDAAMRLLDRAAQLGFDEPEHARNDPDLTSLLAEPRFDAWLQRLNKSAAG